MSTRLISKYNRYNLILNFFILLAGGVCFILVIRWILTSQLNQDLEQEKAEIEEYVVQNNALPAPMSFKGQIVTYKEVEKEFEKKIKNEYRFAKKEKEAHKDKFRMYRTIKFPIELNGKIYSCKIMRSQAETEDLIQIMAVCAVGLGLLLFVLIFLSNRFLFKKIWYPFQRTLKQLKQFKLSSQQSFIKEKTDIQEFQELNDVAAEMTDLARKEYNSLKDFTENASHEIQTPLAIIKSKLEMLMQSGNIRSEESEFIESAYEASIRLSRLNQALLLLTKIENNQYDNTENVSLKQTTQHLTEQYRELINAGNIQLTTDIKEDMVLKMDSVLTEILIGNLLRNAIRHNIPNGFIQLYMDKNILRISNSGSAIHGSTSKLFDRFQKEASSSKSLGLGLAIVSTIVQKYGFQIRYEYGDGTHIIELTNKR
ncbi:MULTISPECIES: sensor histidine kinase [Chitinophagaceae]